MLNEYLIYWIHNESETDIESQGYVGITKDLKRRTKEHNTRSNFLLGRTIEVFLCGEKEYCKLVEKQLRPRKNIGLNVASGGGIPPNQIGIKKSDKTKLLMSKNNVGFKGRKHTEETKQKMRESHKNQQGIPHTLATKKKLSEIAKQRKSNPMTGRNHSDYTRQLISQKLKKK